MTEETRKEQHIEEKKDLARRWGIVGLGVAVATYIVAKGFADNNDEPDEYEVDFDPEAEEDVEIEIEVTEEA